MGYSWSLPRQRKRVRYEAPQGRRVNALAAYRPFGRTPRLEVFTAERTWDAYDLLGFLKALPWSKVPRVVVLDNASIHTSKVIRQARRRLATSGIYLYFLPPYSPELNQVEPVFRQVKHQEIPQRSFTTRADLREAVVIGFDNYGRKLRPKYPKGLRPAAYTHEEMVQYQAFLKSVALGQAREAERKAAAGGADRQRWAEDAVSWRAKASTHERSAAEYRWRADLKQRLRRGGW